MKFNILWFILFYQCTFAQVPANLFQGIPAPQFTKSLQKGIALNDDWNGNTVSDGKKSVPLGILYSLLLPGMGELYAGNYDKGKYFTIAEGALWVAYGGIQSYGDWIQSDARNFAVQHAGINFTNKNDQYFIDIGNFVSVNDYNTEILRERQYDKIYDPNSLSAWHWDTDANREAYRLLRVSSDEKFNNARFVLAAIVTNHIISAIDAARMIILNNKNNESELIHIKANVLGDLQHPNGMMLTFSKNF
ncbi:MAG: hypothetical protein ACHQQQ_08415 [Bacteroidota bacterium]